jgi:accessory gene regulator protein AgrB
LRVLAYDGCRAWRRAKSVLGGFSVSRKKENKKKKKKKMMMMSLLLVVVVVVVAIGVGLV